MSERGEFNTPELEIAQSEKAKFQRLLRDVVGKQKYPIVEHPVSVNGEAKIAEVEVDKDGSTGHIRLRSTEPIGPNNEFVYDHMFYQKHHSGRQDILFYQGTLQKNKEGRLIDSVHVWRGNYPNLIDAEVTNILGKMFRREMEGEPIDEFRMMMSVLEQIKAEQKQPSLKQKLVKIFDKFDPQQFRL